MAAGSGYYCSGCGTVFKITPAGKLTTLYNFCSQTNCTDGYEPLAGLAQARNGNLYGTTISGGANGLGGTVFEITPAGKLTTLYSFCSRAHCFDGADPLAPPIQAADGFLYGTTNAGGTNCVYLGGCGTIFKISTSGHLTRFYSFCAQTNCDDGSQPAAGLIQDTDGNFFGTTTGGGPNGYGNVFEITPGGKVTPLHVFNYTDGYNPLAGLVQAANGNLYGTTDQGGSNGANTLGTIFGISLGN
jgi:uncharacterized repeat protein (TIGR03803 family)